MALKKLLAVAVAAGALFAGTSAQALVTVTLDPQASNGGAGVIDATEPMFNATGFLGTLSSVLTISGTGAGVHAVTESGRVTVSDFQLGNALVGSNVGDPGKYNIFADFTLTGFGSWTSIPGFGDIFTGSPFGASLTMTLGADTNGDSIVDIVLGSGVLDPTQGIAASATTFAPSLGGGSLTSFSATIDFTPAPGTTGVGGFFRAPTPFSIDIAAGNVGGNTLDTVRTAGPAGSVIYTTTGGSGNFDFVQSVPEPSALVLAGMALVAAGATARRRKQAAQS